MPGHVGLPSGIDDPSAAARLEARSPRGRIASAVLGAWGALTGIAPHVLHHVGPLAGAAFLAGAGGRALFAGVAFVASIPFLVRMRRRFRNWLAPVIAFAVMAGAFSLSTFVIGPAISGEASTQPPAGEPTLDEHGHEQRRIP